jgi:hypothetical protein
LSDEIGLDTTDTPLHLQIRILQEVFVHPVHRPLPETVITTILRMALDTEAARITIEKGFDIAAGALFTVKGVTPPIGGLSRRPNDLHVTERVPDAHLMMDRRNPVDHPTILDVVHRVVTVVIVDVLEEFAAVHDVEELGTTTDTEHRNTTIETELEHLDVIVVSGLVEMRHRMPFLAVQRRIDIGTTREDHEIGVLGEFRLRAASGNEHLGESCLFAPADVVDIDFQPQFRECQERISHESN